MALRPVSRRDLIARLRALGFDGPYAGGKHAYMERGSRRVRIPNPHQADIGVPLLRELFRIAEIAEAEWDPSGR